MGCFSYLCQACGTPINSDSFTGERVELFLLKKGKVIERLSGEYDSYGRTMGQAWTVMPWGEIVDLHFGKKADSGIAAVHSVCWDGEPPKRRSRNDPNQGWGEVRPQYRKESRANG